MRKLLLSKSDESYLQRYADCSKLGYGLIIGQQINTEMFVVVCLSKCAEHYFEARDEDSDAITDIQSIEQIEPRILTLQWAMALKMIPGCFKVLGLYVASMNPDILTEHTFKAAEELLYNMHGLLLRTNSCFTSVDQCYDSQYAFLAYSYTTCQSVSKWYRHGQQACILSPMVSRFLGKSFPWVPFECTYRFNGTFPIYDRIFHVNLEDPFEQALDMVRSDLTFSEVLINNKPVADGMPLEVFLNNKEAVGEHYTGEQPLELTVFLPVECQTADENNYQENHCTGKVRFCGEVSSRLWAHPQNLLGNIKRFVRDDLFRSLARRVQLYTNSMVSPTVRLLSVHETMLPRRVYFAVAKNTIGNPIQFSDYLFANDNLEETVTRAKRVLDLSILAEDIEDDVENLLNDEDHEAKSTTPKCKARTSRKLLRWGFMLGLLLCLLALTMAVMWQTTFGEVKD